MRGRFLLLSKLVCGAIGNASSCVTNIFGRLDNPESHGVQNAINVRIPLIPGKRIVNFGILL